MMEKDSFYWNCLWNSYGKNVPWNVEQVDENLYNIVKENKFDKILEIGCGSGTDTNFLSDKCNSITSIDISSKAIDIANETVCKKNVSFKCIDFFNFYHKDKFDFIFDRGCLHGFETTLSREKFAIKIQELLTDDGIWISIIGSLENVIDNEGPPQWSMKDIVNAIDNHLQIKLIKQSVLKNRNGILSPAWIVISSKRNPKL